jgi:GDPmannose 4,6-dehydratase
MRRALILGVTGQDGSYLAELLLAKGYEVHGVMRRSSSFNTSRIDHLYQDRHEGGPFHLHFGDLADGGSLERVLGEVEPEEVYNLGAQSHVRVSFDLPEYTCDVVGLGVLRLLEALRRVCPRARIYQASSSEMFGGAPPPQSEATRFRPRSPYACAKVFAHELAGNYREAYGLHVCCGILFNHESERRTATFVSRKVTLGAARIAAGLQRRLYLGNLEARRDWGYAPEYMVAAWAMLQQDRPDDYVIATGETHTVRELVEVAFAEVGLDWHEHVEIDPRYYRPTEVDALCGDATKARRLLGWQPATTFAALVRRMVEADRVV